MAIWIYAAEERDRDRIAKEVQSSACIYCAVPLNTLRCDETSKEGPTWRHQVAYSKSVRCCPVCGWWYVRVHQTGSDDPTIYPGFPYRHEKTHGASGVLRNLDLSDQSLPLYEIRQYLAARYNERLLMTPAKFEDVVASVYRDLGYDVEVTGRSGDGGIDVVLRGSQGHAIGVQVKRYKGKIEAEQIRAFTGALCIKGLLRGIFVTTSQFTRGALDTAVKAATVNYTIELVDADRFYAQLGLAQRRAYETPDDLSAPYASPRLLLLNMKTGR